MSHHMIAHAIQHKTYPRTRTRLGVTRVQHPIRDIESQRYDQCVYQLQMRVPSVPTNIRIPGATFQHTSPEQPNSYTSSLFYVKGRQPSDLTWGMTPEVTRGLSTPKLPQAQQYTRVGRHPPAYYPSLKQLHFCTQTDQYTTSQMHLSTSSIPTHTYNHLQTRYTPTQYLQICTRTGSRPTTSGIQLHTPCSYRRFQR